MILKFIVIYEVLLAWKHLKSESFDNKVCILQQRMNICLGHVSLFYIVQLHPETKGCLSQNVSISIPSWQEKQSATGALQQSSGLLNALKESEI